MDDPSDNSDLSDNLLVRDSNYEIISEIEIEVLKLEAISEEDNGNVQCMNKLVESGKQVLFEHSYFKQSNESQELLTQVIDNQISDIIKNEPAENEEEATTSTSQISTQFVDCGPTIKEEIKEENVEFHDPLRLSYVVQSLDEPVTYEEFFVWS